jgi:MFS family permease
VAGRLVEDQQPGPVLGGRTGDILGRRRLFVGGIALFTAASLVGGLATSAGWLLTARVLQGVGAAAAAATTLLVALTFRPLPANRP